MICNSIWKPTTISSLIKHAVQSSPTFRKLEKKKKKKWTGNLSGSRERGNRTEQHQDKKKKTPSEIFVYLCIYLFRGSKEVYVWVGMNVRGIKSKSWKVRPTKRLIERKDIECNEIGLEPAWQRRGSGQSLLIFAQAWESLPANRAPSKSFKNIYEAKRRNVGHSNRSLPKVLVASWNRLDLIVFKRNTVQSIYDGQQVKGQSSIILLQS